MPRRLLVIDSVAVNRIRLAVLFETAQYDVNCVASAQDAPCKGLQDPDLILLGIQSQSPAQAIAELRANTRFTDTPLLCIDAESSPMRRLQGLRAGARDILQRALPDGLLLARLRGLVREGDAERECERRRMAAASFGFSEAAAAFPAKLRVACIGDLTAFPTLPGVLAASLPHRFDSPSLDDVLREDDRGKSPDAYVIVSGIDYLSLDGLMPELRDRSHSKHASVLVLHPDDRPDIATRALNLGASDIASDKATGEELAIRINAMLKHKALRDTLRQSDEQSYRLAVTDPLTGLYNRRYAEAYLADLLLQGDEVSQNFVVMMVDLDHFKTVNDGHGHSAGDRALCEVADRLKDNIRACDLVARYGGEEFLVILPETKAAEAKRTAERLRAAISSTPVAIEGGDQLELTASIGVAIGSASEISHTMVRTGTFDFAEASYGNSLPSIFDAADGALYRAKQLGRNRVEFSGV